MPKYLYTGDGPCRYGATEVRKGDVIDASASPGKNFREVPAEPEPPPRKRAPAQEPAQ